MRDRFPHRTILTLAALVVAFLLLIHPQMPVTLAQVGADKRPTPTPTPKHTKTHSTPQPTKPHQSAPKIEMVLIPAGTFLMGSPESETRQSIDDEGPQHRVSVRQFYIGKYEVTQAQYKAVMGTNPSFFKGDDLPVENVSWNDAVAFCRNLSLMTGKEYRLPTEAEWEYACRAGTTGPYAGELDSMAWYSKNSGFKTHPVGEKQPNAFGLYDMHGNVWEWCQDWYGPYPSEQIDNPTGPGHGTSRVVRGGSWNRTAIGVRSGHRFDLKPDHVDRDFGFRVVAVARSS